MVVNIFYIAHTHTHTHTQYNMYAHRLTNTQITR